MPEISVILKVDDGNGYLQEAVNNVFMQSFSDFELLVLKEGANYEDTLDGMDTIDMRLRILNVVSFEEPGVWGQVMESIKGKYVVLMDAGHLMVPRKLHTQFSFMEDHRDVDVCGTWVTENGNSGVNHFYQVRHNDIVIEMLFSKAIYTQSVIMRKSVFGEFLKTCLGKIQRHECVEYYEIWTDLIMKGYLFANIPEVLLNIRTGENVSLFSDPSLQRVGLRYVQCCYLDYLMNKIIELDPAYFDFLNSAVELQNSNKLTFEECKGLVRSIYIHTREKEEIHLKDGKIRILFCIDTLGGGGAEKLLIDILKRFDYEKYAVDLLVLFEEGIYFADIPEEVSWFFPGSEKVKNRFYDIEVAFLEGLAVKYIAERGSVAVKVAWVHADLCNYHWTKRYYENDEHEYSIFQRMDKIVFVSDNVKEQYIKLFGDAKSELLVIYNLIDRSELLSKWDCVGITKRKFTLCSIGRLTLVKGYLLLIHAVRHLVEDGLDFDLWIVGEGEQRVKLEELIKEFLLGDIVFLQGYHKNPMPFLKEADVFVSSSLSEGFPLVICEALCLGLPVVATKNAGSEEVLSKGKYGLLTEQDEFLLYKALKAVIENVALRDDLRNKALERAELFNESAIMDQIYTVLG